MLADAREWSDGPMTDKAVRFEQGQCIMGSPARKQGLQGTPAGMFPGGQAAKPGVRPAW